MATKVVCAQQIKRIRKTDTNRAPLENCKRGVAIAIKWEAKALAFASPSAQAAHQMFVEIIA